jgi:hypothetical protein
MSDDKMKEVKNLLQKLGVNWEDHKFFKNCLCATGVPANDTDDIEFVNEDLF